MSSHLFRRRYFFPLGLSAIFLIGTILLAVNSGWVPHEHAPNKYIQWHGRARFGFGSEPIDGGALENLDLDGESLPRIGLDRKGKKLINAVDIYRAQENDMEQKAILIQYYTIVLTHSTTITSTKVESTTYSTTKTITDGPVETVTATDYVRIRPAKPIPTWTSIDRRFERYHGEVEDYQKSLTDKDKMDLEDIGLFDPKEDRSNSQEVLEEPPSDEGETKQEDLTPRQQRLQRMYELDGPDEWLEFIKDNDESAMPPLTKWTQEYIYNHQHPPKHECKNKKFIVLQHNWDGNGLGTVVHGTGWILGLAIRLGRILIYNETMSPGRNFYEPNCLYTKRKSGVTDSRSMDCIFEPLSSCGEEDIQPGNAISMRSYWKHKTEFREATVPPIFGYGLKKKFPEMHEDAIKYWWRAQAAAYMLRMNGPALRRVKEIRMDKSIQIAFTHVKGKKNEEEEKEEEIPEPPADTQRHRKREANAERNSDHSDVFGGRYTGYDELPAELKAKAKAKTSKSPDTKIDDSAVSAADTIPTFKSTSDTSSGYPFDPAPSSTEEYTMKEVSVPFPLPDGSFSMHVRHGDKHVEMELIPFTSYVSRAEEHAAMNPLSSRKICFISSENPEVFEEARSITNLWLSTNTTSNTYWTWVYSDIPRLNGGPVEQLQEFGNRTEMTIKWMSQLFMAVEATNVVGTRGSGWNRMVDEIRCIWVDCRGSYMEVGPFEDWVHYNF